MTKEIEIDIDIPEPRLILCKRWFMHGENGKVNPLWKELPPKKEMKVPTLMKPVVFGMMYECPVCGCLNHVSQEEKDRIMMNAVGKALKASLKESEYPDLAEIDIAELFQNPEKEIKRIVMKVENDNHNE